MEGSTTAAAKNALRVRVKTSTGRLEYELQVGEGLTLGRGTKADIRIKDRSVSGLHLRVTWTGSEVRVEDLASSNGSFRLPQESPFQKSDFPPLPGDLQLRLGQAQIALEWQPLALLTAEPTAVQSGTATLEKGLFEPALPTQLKVADVTRLGPAPEPKRPPESLKEALAAKPLRVDPREAPVHWERRVLGKRPVPSSQAAGAAFWLVAALGSSLLFGLSLYLGHRAWDRLLVTPPELLRHGGMVDLVLLWVDLLRSNLDALLVVSGGFGILLLALYWGKDSALRFLSERLENLILEPTIFLQIIFSFTLLGSFLWPGLWAWSQGVGPSSWSAAAEFWKVFEVPAEKRLPEMRKLGGRLTGSSLYFKARFDLERQRVIRECGGIGPEAEWERKKICLLLLSAVGIETLGDAQPALLGDVAARAAVLLSLDGITRVLAAEGPQAPTLPFFLNSLEAVGLGPERDDISKILNDSRLSLEELRGSLLDLRKKIELRMQARQDELGYPKVFRLELPGPLESGI